jgi:hypothetical protein
MRHMSKLMALWLRLATSAWELFLWGNLTSSSPNYASVVGVGMVIEVLSLSKLLK